MTELEVPVVAVVNHLGERLLITVDQYRSGQWQLWEEREGSVDPATTSSDPPDPSPELTQRRRKRN